MLEETTLDDIEWSPSGTLLTDPLLYEFYRLYLRHQHTERWPEHERTRYDHAWKWRLLWEAWQCGGIPKRMHKAALVRPSLDQTILTYLTIWPHATVADIAQRCQTTARRVRDVTNGQFRATLRTPAK